MIRDSCFMAVEKNIDVENIIDVVKNKSVYFIRQKTMYI